MALFESKTIKASLNNMFVVFVRGIEIVSGIEICLRNVVGNCNRGFFDPKLCQDHKIEEPVYHDCIESSCEDFYDQENNQ
jgi:hypothetical protein